MLKKLLKYDLESIFKFLVAFYGVALFFGIVTRIFLNVSDSFLIHMIGQICSITTVAMLFCILINNVIRLWVRFQNQFYGDASYLTHTLPVEKKTLYLSKIMASIVTLVTSLLVMALTLVIAYYSKENLEMLENSLLPIASAYGSTIIKILLAFLFVFFLEVANILQAGYTGIILGHKMDCSKGGYSILFGFGCYLFIQIVVLFLMFLVALGNPDIMNLFFTNEVIDVDMVKMIILLSSIIYSIILIVGYWVNLKLFKQGVNVD